jgi:hypothetical protein
MTPGAPLNSTTEHSECDCGDIGSVDRDQIENTQRQHLLLRRKPKLPCISVYPPRYYQLDRNFDEQAYDRLFPDS